MYTKEEGKGQTNGRGYGATLSSGDEGGGNMEWKRRF